MPQLGRPAIQTPNRLELRPLQLAIENIKARLKACDLAITDLSSAADANTTGTRLAALISTVQQLTLRVSALEVQLGADDAVILIAGETVAAYDAIVAITTTSCAPADPSDPLRISAVIGVARNSANVGQPVTIQRRGYMTIPGAGFEVNRPVYVGIGGLTQMPAYGAYAIPVAMAVSPTTIWIGAGWPALQQDGIYGSVFDDYLPVTWGLIRERLALLDALLEQPPGFVVFDGDALITRELVGGDGISIENPDGVDGDPVISAAGDSIPTGSLTFTGHVPTIVVTTAGGVVEEPGTGAMTLTGHAPTAVATGSMVVQPGAGAITLAGQTPSLGAEYSPWDVSSLPSGVTASEGDYRLTKSGSSTVSAVYHPVTRSSGKYAIRLLGLSAGGASSPGPACGLINGAIGSFLGSSPNAVALWMNNLGTDELNYRNNSFVNLGNLAGFAVDTEIMIEVDFDTGKVWFGVAGSWVGSGNPAAGTGEQYILPTSTVFSLVVDMYYNGQIKLLTPDEFTFPATSGFTPGWPD